MDHVTKSTEAAWSADQPLSFPPDGNRRLGKTEPRVTLRCWRDDLKEAPRDLCGEAETNQALRKLCTFCTLQPAGTERLQAITDFWIGKVPIGNQYRIVTWHDREFDIVWLLGFGLKLGGERRNVYEQIAALHERGDLLPTVDDYEIYFRDRDSRAIPRMIFELQALLTRARRDSPYPRSTLIAGLVHVTVVVENLAEAGDAAYEEVYVSMSTRNLQPGWLDVIRAALLPTVDPRAWEFARVVPGLDASGAGELRFRHFHDLDQVTERSRE